MAQRLQLAASSLAEFPMRGRPVGRLRELVAVQPYIIRYRIIADGSVQIIRIRHGAQHQE